MKESEVKSLTMIIEFFDHERVWNSIDKQWSHPSYCVTCRNIEIVKNNVR